MYAVMHERIIESVKLFCLECVGDEETSCLCNLAFMILTLLMTPESCSTYMVVEKYSAVCLRNKTREISSSEIHWKNISQSSF